MPAHTSHRLQPLNVGCFSPLKHAYGLEIQELARQRVFHINKEDFLLVYAKVQPSVLLEQNIKSGFLAIGPVPYDPQRVLSLLPICQTPSPLSTANDLAPYWTSETPRIVA